MKCRICSIKHKELKDEIENLMNDNDGFLTAQNKAALATKYPGFEDQIHEVTDDDCDMHWNFHQAISRVPCAGADLSIGEGGEELPAAPSLANDINKDEARALGELLYQQAATFTALSNKFNETLSAKDTDLTISVIHPNNAIMYRETAESIRATVKLMSELNASINGSKNGALEGLKALAQALSPAEGETNKPMNTHEYED